VPLAEHPSDGCSCSDERCWEVATTATSRSARSIARPRCDRHARADVAQAERYGIPLLLMRMPDDVPLPMRA
jgi:hypothetical protein